MGEPRARLNRIAPALQPSAYRTYSVSAPAATHWREASCEEADCPAWRHGWVTTVDPMATPAVVHYIRTDKSRRHTEETLPDGRISWTFAPGQECFATHRTQVRPDIHLVRDGDWRWGANTRALPVGQWVEHFQENQDRLATLVDRG